MLLKSGRTALPSSRAGTMSAKRCLLPHFKLFCGKIHPNQPISRGKYSTRNIIVIKIKKLFPIYYSLFNQLHCKIYMHINVLNILSNIQINLISLPPIIYIYLIATMYIPNRYDVGDRTCSVSLACLTYYIFYPLILL